MTIKELYEESIKKNAEDFTIYNSEWGLVVLDEIDWDEKHKTVTL